MQEAKDRAFARIAATQAPCLDGTRTETEIDGKTVDQVETTWGTVTAKVEGAEPAVSSSR